MANYSREELEKQGKAEGAVVGGLLIGLAGLIVSCAKNSSEKGKIQNEINAIDAEINDYRSKFLGSVLYSNEIATLQKKRKELAQKLK